MLEPVTIANGTATSTGADMGAGAAPAGIIWDATMTQSAAIVQAQWDNTNWVTVQQVGGGADYPVTVASGKYTPLDPRAFKACRKVRVVMGGNEAGDRTLRFVKDVFA